MTGRRRLPERNQVLALEEALWWDDIENRDSILPILELLERTGRISRFIHFTTATREEFIELLLSTRRRTSYKLIYLAYHAEDGAIQVGRGNEPGSDRLPLRELASLLGKRTGAVIHLSGCRTVPTRKSDEVRRFLDATGAAALCGFATDVDWTRSAAFDVLLLDGLAHYKQVGNAIRNLAPARSLSAHLGFRCYQR